MLPAPQMQTSAIAGSQTFDPISSVPLLDNAGPHNDHLRRFASSYWRSFPIRISQSQAQAAVPTSHHGILIPEYNLRRKTPRGTVEAGYDGSLNQPFPGPPPLKHMILPMSASTQPHTPVNLNPGPSQQSWDPSLMPANSFSFSHGSLPGLGHSAMLSNVAEASHSLPLYGPPQPSDFYQPVLRANELNVRAFCPPPDPISGSLMFGQIGWQSAGSPWEHRNSELIPHLGPDGGGAAEITSNRYATQGEQPIHPGRFARSSGAGPVDTADQRAQRSQWTVHPHQGINLAAVGAGTVFTEQPHFREKALIQAQQSYIELLAYLQANGRNNPIKANPGSRTSQKLPAYPKPPKLRGTGVLKGNGLTTSGMLPSVAHNVDASHRARRLIVCDDSRPRQSSTPYGGSSMPGERYSLMTYPKTAIDQSGDFFGNFTSTARPLPISNAISSLDILNSLCEQSHWTWVDGMLVGGCLQYALERFENAAKLFSKIVALDSR